MTAAEQDRQVQDMIQAIHDNEPDGSYEVKITKEFGSYVATLYEPFSFMGLTRTKESLPRDSAVAALLDLFMHKAGC